MFSEDEILNTIMTHCCDIRPEQKVIVECIDIPQNIIVKLTEKILALQATPILIQKSQLTIDHFAEKGSPEMFKAMADVELFQMSQAQHFIGLRSPLGNQGIANVPQSQMQVVLKHYVEPVHYRYRNHNLNWIYLRWPSEYMATRAGMDYESFATYYQKAINIDFLKMDLAMDALVSVLKNAKEVHVKGPGETDLRFELGDIGVYKSIGKKNLPDGEVFTAPVKESVNGIVTFNIDSTYYGTHFSEVRLEFSNGKVINASAGKQTGRLLELLDIDEGARFIGEFAFGLNPKVDKPINDILFDEKMHGSIHFALGNAYPVADNGNRSAIHWDLILNQNEIHGGGELYLNGVLVRKNGKFVHDSLYLLNPEYL